MHEKETDLKNNVFESQESSLGAIGFCAVIRLPAAALAAEGRGEEEASPVTTADHQHKYSSSTIIFTFYLYILCGIFLV